MIWRTCSTRLYQTRPTTLPGKTMLPLSRAQSKFTIPGLFRAISSRSDPTGAQLDIRRFLDVLREDDDLVEIDDEVDPHLEIGAIVRKVSETNNLAPLFNNVKHAKRGLWRIFGKAASLRPSRTEEFGRLARTLGLSPTATWKDLTEKTIAGMAGARQPPIVVSDAPCKTISLEQRTSIYRISRFLSFGWTMGGNTCRRTVFTFSRRRTSAGRIGRFSAGWCTIGIIFAAWLAPVSIARSYVPSGAKWA